MRRLTGERLQRCRRAGEYGNREGAENLLPTQPIWELHEVIATHQPDETRPRKAPPQRLYGVRGVGGAELGFDIADPDSAVGGGDFPGLLQPLGERRHPGDRFERVLRRHQPPDFIEIEPLQRLAADMQVPAMRRIERAAEQPDAPSCCGADEAPSPPLGAERAGVRWG